jgi:hypothetical protein
MIVISLLSCIFSRGGTKGPKSVEYAWNERRDVTAEPCSAGTGSWCWQYVNTGRCLTDDTLCRSWTLRSRVAWAAFQAPNRTPSTETASTALRKHQIESSSPADSVFDPPGKGDGGRASLKIEPKSASPLHIKGTVPESQTSRCVGWLPWYLRMKKPCARDESQSLDHKDVCIWRSGVP